MVIMKIPAPQLKRKTPMKRSKRWGMLLAVLLGLSLFLPAAWGQLRVRSGALSSVSKSGIQHRKDLEEQVFQLTNEARRKKGLPALEPDEVLSAAARKYSDELLTGNFFSHKDPAGKGPQQRLDEEQPARQAYAYRVGENIAAFSKMDYSDLKIMAEMIMDGWMTSPGHRQNILQPLYTHLGVGVSVQGDQMRVTQEFARRVALK
ncbi:MAG: CAP domain-containing protein [Desulfobaccales bacterium]